MRPDLDLPQVVCEYEDVFLDELSGLSSQRVIDFDIELHHGTSPISMIGWRQLSCRNSESNYRSYWTRGSLDRALHHGGLRFCL